MERMEREMIMERERIMETDGVEREREEGEMMVKVREDVERNMDEERSGEKREDRGEDEGDEERGRRLRGWRRAERLKVMEGMVEGRKMELIRKWRRIETELGAALNLT